MIAIAPAASATRLQYDSFAIGPVGTPLPNQFRTSRGILISAPSADEVRSLGVIAYAHVRTFASLTFPSATSAIAITLYGGAAPGTLRFFDASARQVVVVTSPHSPLNPFSHVTYPGSELISRIDIDWPSGEGGLVDIVFGEAEISTGTPESLRAAGIDEKTCAGIVFAETNVLSSGGGGANALVEARRFIAGVAYKRNGAGVAQPVIPSDGDLKNPVTKQIWTRCQAASKDAASDDVGKCKHFVIWYSDDGKTPSKSPREIPASWPYDHLSKIKRVWGPFSSPIAPKFNEINESTDFTSSIENIYVFEYCGVP